MAPHKDELEKSFEELERLRKQLHSVVGGDAEAMKGMGGQIDSIIPELKKLKQSSANLKKSMDNIKPLMGFIKSPEAKEAMEKYFKKSK